MGKMRKGLTALAVLVGLGVGTAQAAWIDATVFTFEGEGAASLENSGPVGGNLTKVGSPELVDSPQGKAYRFTSTIVGDGGFNNGPHASTALLAETNFANPDYANGYRVEVSFRAAPDAQINNFARLVDHNGAFFLGILENKGHLRFAHRGGTAAVGEANLDMTGVNVADNEWHTVVVIYDPTLAENHLSMTLDGTTTVSRSIDPTNRTFTTTAKFAIGNADGNPTNPRSFNGDIDYVKVQVVPEPAAMGLLGLAAAPLMMRQRSR